MTLVDISWLGGGGAGIPDTLPQAVAELQGLTLSIVSGAAIGVRVPLVNMSPEDTITAALDLTGQATLDPATLTPVNLGFTSTVDLSGKKVLVWWYDRLKATFTPYQERLILDGAVSVWPLDESAGDTTVRDLTGVRPGTVSGAVTLDGTCATFAFTGRIQAGALPPQAGGFSLEAWIWSDQPLTDNPGTCVGRVYADGAGHGGGGYSLSAYNTTSAPPPKVEFVAWMGVRIQPLSLRQWHHLVGTHDGTSQKIYLNGVQAHSIADTNIKPDAVRYPLITLMGGHPTYAPYGYYGKLRDVAAYSRALTAPEIAAHYALKP